MKASRKSKFSLGMKIVCILSCIAIASVGFASWWIINYPQEEAYESGSFEVYAVNQKSVSFSDITAIGNANIIFGAPAEPTTATWLGYTEYNEETEPTGIKEENLSAVLKVTVSIANELTLKDYLNGVNVDFNAGDAFDAVSQAYVGAPQVFYQIGGTEGEWTAADSSDFTIAMPEASSADIYLKFVFSWGDATDGVNPYNYFNEKAIEDIHEDFAQAAEAEQKTNKEVATAMLNTISGLNTNTYNVKITAVPANS